MRRTLVDVSEDALTAARQRARDSGLGNVSFIQAEIPAVAVDGLVDAVIAVGATGCQVHEMVR